MLDADTQRELERIEQRSPTDTIGFPYNRPPEGPRGLPGPPWPSLKFFKVEALKNSEGGAWTDFVTHGFPAYLAGKACKSDGSGLASTMSYLVASTAPTTAPSGVIPAVNAIVGWLPGDGLPVMPGVTPAMPVAGRVIPGEARGDLYPKVID